MGPTDEELVAAFQQGDAAAFGRVLGDREVALVVSELVEPYRERIYPPLDTLRLFVGQVLSADRACQDVVSRRLSERIAQGQSGSALNTGSYCDARQRLPVARIGALIGLASGAILGYQVVACEGKGTGEQSLLGNLLDHLDTGDVVLADALLATWWLIEGAMGRGADVVMAQHGRRITNFTRGRRLGKNDHVVQWPRPPKPKTMSAQEYARYPEFLSMREVEVKGRILVTTLRDPKFVSARALGALYKMRWNIEVDFRTIKASLQMDVLRCKSQPMVEKEIAVCLLAYNLVRWAMAKAASLADVLPRALSFTGVKRVLNAFADQLRRTPGDQIHTTIATVLGCIATLQLPHRPDRIEPRAKKRRPKPLPLLTVPRQIARDLILTQRQLNRVT